MKLEQQNQTNRQTVPLCARGTSSSWRELFCNRRTWRDRSLHRTQRPSLKSKNTTVKRSEVTKHFNFRTILHIRLPCSRRIGEVLLPLPCPTRPYHTTRPPSRQQCGCERSPTHRDSPRQRPRDTADTQECLCEPTNCNKKLKIE